MAINPVLTGERRNQYTSSGSLGPYNFTFVIYADADLSVYVDDTLKTLSTHYTVSTNANGTGSITFTAGNAPASGALVTIIGNKDISRSTRFTSGGPLTADALETEFNAQTALLQQLDEKISRAITLPIETDATRPLEFPYDNTEANNADRVVKFNAAGSALEIGPTAANLETLATIAADISTVAGISADVTSVAADAADIGVVSTNIASVNTVANNINDVITVANDLNEAISEVETVADDLNEAVSEIDTVSNNITDVQTVGNATNIANIGTVAGEISPTNNISTLAAIAADISTLATDLSGSNTIGTVATDLSGSNNIGTVATNIANVNLVGNDIANVNIVANNVGDVNSFSNQYRIGSTDPTTSLDQGDLFYNSTDQALKYYNGSSWASITAGLTDIVADITPQLGGNLDVNGNSIVSVSNGDIAITPNGTGKVVLDGLNYPTADGTNGQALVTDGSGNLSFSNTSSAEVYGFSVNSNGELIVTTTGGGADNIDAATYATFDDVVYASTGFTWSIDSGGNLIATI